MTLTLIKPTEKPPSWMTTVISEPKVVIVKKPSAGFIKHVEKQAQSSEMRKILLSSESEKEKYKTETLKRRHILTPEEMKRGQEALARGNFGIKSGMTQRQEHIEEEKEKQLKLSEPKVSRWDSPKYKTIRSPQNVGISYPSAKKLPIKEQYKRTEISKRGIPIEEPIFGIIKYGKTKKQPKLQEIKNFVRDNFTLDKLKPTQKLIKPIQKVEPKKVIQKPIIRDISIRSLFGGMFETPKTKTIIKQIIKPSEKKVIKKKKPIEKKFKIIKKYYRKYPKHCVKKQRR